ncbi:hypothetical protein RHGRI_030169 [Rhododendron griersonianum]|uniref:Uncharacterized protein n=1 Tax=Rhododendron griersonianum TaxID=479676 RepID=A0AAV6IQG4_9ERIC|nr:hypothetical protein RHGRI_030169 [Rhododendron griersonianum]
MSFWFWYRRDKFGFRDQAPATVVPLYLGYLVLSLAWDPIVFRLGATKVGLLISVVNIWIVVRLSYTILKGLSKNVAILLLDVLLCGWGSFGLLNLNVKLLSVDIVV